jgi:hypothetical protein
LAEYEANAPLQKQKPRDYNTVEVDIGLVGAGEKPCMTEVAGTGVVSVAPDDKGSELKRR